MCWEFVVFCCWKVDGGCDDDDDDDDDEPYYSYHFDTSRLENWKMMMKDSEKNSAMCQCVSEV